MDYEKELNLLSEYLNIYIQLIPQVLRKYPIENFRVEQIKKDTDNKLYRPINKVDNIIFTFEYFKNNYERLTIPTFKETKEIYDGKTISFVPTHGLGTPDGIGYRLYNMFMGMKYYTDNNLTGNYTINIERLNSVLLKHK